MSVFLSVSDVLEIHRLVVAATGGADGCRDAGLLDSAVHRPQSAFGGVAAYPDIAAQAAALLHSLAKNHPFVDGNKRTAYAAMRIFLRLNGCDLVASEDDKYDFVIAVASSTMGIDDAVLWIRSHLKMLDE